MISKQDKSLLKNLFQSPQWRLVEQIASDLVLKWRSESCVRDSEWETVKTLLINEGQSRGVKSLLQEILDQAQHE